MITNELEYFTAKQAVDEGLYEAIKRGETVVAGYYEYGKDGELDFKQQNFVFKDKSGTLRIGKFHNADNVLEFLELMKNGGIDNV